MQSVAGVAGSRLTLEHSTPLQVISSGFGAPYVETE